MKKITLFLFLLVSFGFQSANNTLPSQTTSQKESGQTETLRKNKPKVSFTFDDGITNDILAYSFEEWNSMILSTLKAEELTAVFFVTGKNKLDKKGDFLLKSWSNDGHLIANHTFTHPNFNNEKRSVKDFEQELLKTDTVISQYKNYVKLFRFPYLKEGNTEEKISGFRSILQKHGYKNGHVTIDASDWYINGELIKCLQEEGLHSPKMEKYQAFYLEHIMERANYYEKLACELTNRNITHTLLLHHNLTSALFLDDLIKKFKDEGWEVVDADTAFQDKIFKSVPNVSPAGESLIWSLAKASGKYEGQLRYPAEDSQYEIPKMKKWGL